MTLLKSLIEAVVEAKRYDIRTHCIAQVRAYDAEANTVELQPVTHGVRFTDPDNLVSVPLPLLKEVPVSQVGSGPLWATVAPAEGSYGIVHICDRIIDDWKAAGGVNAPSEIRCHSLSDGIFEPSVVHLVVDGDNGAFEEPIKTDRISFRTRSSKTEISVLSDETIQINNEKASVTIDADGNVTITSEGEISLDNGTSSLLIGDTVNAGGGADYVALAKKVDDTIQALMDAFNDASVVPTPQDGGAGLYGLLLVQLAARVTPIGSVASNNLKADG